MFRAAIRLTPLPTHIHPPPTQGRDNPLIALRRPPTTTLNSAPRTLSYNPAEHAVLITSDVEGGSFELYQLPKDAGRGESAPVGWVGWVAIGWAGLSGGTLNPQYSQQYPHSSPPSPPQEAKRGQGASAVFIARNRFAVLDRASGVIQVRFEGFDCCCDWLTIGWLVPLPAFQRQHHNPPPLPTPPHPTPKGPQPPERGHQEVPPALRLHRRALLRRDGPAAVPRRGQGGALRRAAAPRARGAAHAADKVGGWLSVL